MRDVRQCTVYVVKEIQTKNRGIFLKHSKLHKISQIYLQMVLHKS